MEKNIACSDKDKNIAEYIRQWGNAISLALLDPACNFFTIPTHEGVIGYKCISHYVIVFGDPVCPPESLEALMMAFHYFCVNNKKKIIYIATTEKFTQFALKNYCHISIEIGVNLSLNPIDDVISKTGRTASGLRNKINQSKRFGIEIREYKNFDAEIEQEMHKVHALWLQHRKGVQIYLYPVDFFTDRPNKRWFYALHNKEIVGILMLNRIDSHAGWALNILMIKPDAPSTVSEYILLSVFETLRLENCKHFSVGAIPADTLGNIEGCGVISKWFARRLYILAKKFFNLENRFRYWKKFNPYTQRAFVMLSHSTIKISDIWSIIHALHGKI